MLEISEKLSSFLISDLNDLINSVIFPMIWKLEWREKMDGSFQLIRWAHVDDDAIYPREYDGNLAVYNGLAHRESDEGKAEEFEQIVIFGINKDENDKFFFGQDSLCLHDNKRRKKWYNARNSQIKLAGQIYEEIRGKLYEPDWM